MKFIYITINSYYLTPQSEHSFCLWIRRIINQWIFEGSFIIIKLYPFFDLQTQLLCSIFCSLKCPSCCWTPLAKRHWPRKFSISLALWSPSINNSSAYHAYPRLIYKDASQARLKICNWSEYYASIFEYSALLTNYFMQNDKLVESPLESTHGNSIVQYFEFEESHILAIG